LVGADEGETCFGGWLGQVRLAIIVLLIKSRGHLVGTDQGELFINSLKLLSFFVISQIELQNKHKILQKNHKNISNFHMILFFKPFARSVRLPYRLVSGPGQKFLTQVR